MIEILALFWNLVLVLSGLAVLFVLVPFVLAISFAIYQRITHAGD